MKRFIICTLAFLSVSALTVSAQNKGDKYVGGMLGVGVSASFVEDISATATNVGIAPEFGYFVADKFKVGAGIGYSLNISGATSHALTVCPNVAYYVKLCNNFYYTPTFEIGFAYGHSEGLNGVGFGLGLSIAGFEFRPSTHFGLSVNLLSLSYVFLSYPDYGLNSNNVTFNLGVNPSVGVKYYF